jgi:hypothetical protein
VTKFLCGSLAGRPLEEEVAEIQEWEGKTDHFGSRGFWLVFLRCPIQILIGSTITLTEVVCDFHLLATGQYREITVNRS